MLLGGQAAVTANYDNFELLHNDVSVNIWLREKKEWLLPIMIFFLWDVCFQLFLFPKREYYVYMYLLSPFSCFFFFFALSSGKVTLIDSQDEQII